ncbi:MAG: ribonuclease E/G [Alphaproteobacteria bacterium]|nr:ribonuclease E/G [Alphaproteobacteria bacterium]MBU2379991.1 ribonuclease E/G [Alphaproteobacteria bacterium]
MTGDVEVFLDDTPGEARGIVTRDGRFERLMIQREDDPPQHRLGARCVGRVIGLRPAFRAAFIDIGGDGPAGFLPLGKGESLGEGEVIEVEVTAEPRQTKGPALKRIGSAQGKPRLVAPGPDVVERLGRIAPGVEPVRGVDAIRAGLEAEAEALASGEVFAEWALDLAVQRTRALIAVDIDHAGIPGRDVRKARDQANRQGLKQAARMIRLRGWGGLVVIDLVGVTLDPAQVSTMAREAFADDDAAFGPLSRFGVLQLALPWRERPVEESLNDAAGRRGLITRAIDVARHLRLAMLSDTATPRFTARCAPEEAAVAVALVRRVGPRATLLSDPKASRGRFVIEEG